MLKEIFEQLINETITDKDIKKLKGKKSGSTYVYQFKVDDDFKIEPSNILNCSEAQSLINDVIDGGFVIGYEDEDYTIYSINACVNIEFKWNEYKIEISNIGIYDDNLKFVKPIPDNLIKEYGIANLIATIVDPVRLEDGEKIELSKKYINDLTDLVEKIYKGE